MAKCMFPYEVERKLYFSQTDRTVPVPCGKCPECLKRRVQSWLYRLEMESHQWPYTYFLTLTYENDFCPISENGFMSLKPDDVSRFLKRLRHLVGDLRYYYCGEYGTEVKRPHYHMILFTSVDATRYIDQEWCNPLSYSTDTRQRSPYGHVFYGDVQPKSITYTVQYYDKGDWRPLHDRDDRVPEYSRMSKNIGQNFLSLEMVQHIFDRPDKAYIYNHEGKKIATPTYYKRRIYDYVLPEGIVLYHPSCLVHRDEMIGLKELHLQEMQLQALKHAENAKPDDYRQHRAKAAAIKRYKESKRKTRK